MYLRIQILCGLLAGLILATAACAPAGPGIPVTGETPAPNTPTGSPELPPKAVLDAQRWLAMQLSTTVERVQINKVEQMEWTDSCLGLGRANESCLQVITPGWRVIFEIDGQRYEVRTDKTGSIIRLATPAGTPDAENMLENTHWRFVSFGSPQGEQTIIEEAQITLMLADGKLEGFGGCNSYSGPYELSGNNISIGTITSTLRACADPQATEREQRYLQALEAANQIELHGNQLVITYDDGAGLLIFEPQPPAEPLPASETPVT